MSSIPELCCTKLNRYYVQYSKLNTITFFYLIQIPYANFYLGFRKSFFLKTSLSQSTGLSFFRNNPLCRDFCNLWMAFSTLPCIARSESSHTLIPLQPYCHNSPDWSTLKHIKILALHLDPLTFSFLLFALKSGLEIGTWTTRPLSIERTSSDVCLSFVLLFTIFIIVVTQKLVLQQSKNVTAKCTETLSHPPSIQFSLLIIN